jgi:hypothetical protein
MAEINIRRRWFAEQEHRVILVNFWSSAPRWKFVVPAAQIFRNKAG